MNDIVWILYENFPGMPGCVMGTFRNPETARECIASQQWKQKQDYWICRPEGQESYFTVEPSELDRLTDSKPIHTVVDFQRKTGKTLWVFRGEAGTGKTSNAQEVVVNASHMIAADDFPAFWATGSYEYDFAKQGESHQWCQAGVRQLMEQAVSAIAVHNTFRTIEQMQPYFDLAKEFGYVVKVQRCEGVILPDGTFARNAHEVPEEVVQKMRDNWEPLRPVTPKGISLSKVAEIFAKLKPPEVILLDMDKSAKITESGKDYPQTPQDAKLHPVMVYLALLVKLCNPKIYIVSNQRGIGKKKTVEFLKAEFTYLLGLLQESGISIAGARFAIDKKHALVWENNDLVERQMPDRADKPGVGMALDILQPLKPQNVWGTESLWMIGDAHTSRFDDDYQFALNCWDKQLLAVNYVPVEMLAIAVSLVGA